MPDSAPNRGSPVFDLEGRRVWVAGHRGMVGSALVRRLEREPIGELVHATSDELDLRDGPGTIAWVADRRPDVAILAAARVGGIHANRSAPGSFLYDNLMIGANTLEACRLAGVSRIVVLGSSCIYPRDAGQPIREDALLTGPLEETNRAYAVAKIAALEQVRAYRVQYGTSAIALMPTNLYGPGDNFDLETSHVLPALIRRIHEAKLASADRVVVWGTGRVRREFLHADDLADATVHLLCQYDADGHVNVGVGEDLTIRELARLIAEVVGWRGSFTFDTSMPDGTPRKLLDVSRLRATGWTPRISLRDGIAATYEWYLRNSADARGVRHEDRSAPPFSRVPGRRVAAR
jgi:GDP-L-fucose synthase